MKCRHDVSQDCPACMQEEIDQLRNEIGRLCAGLESIVNCRNPLTRAAVREACAEILAGRPANTSGDRNAD